MAIGKRLKSASASIDREKFYSVDDAVKIAAESAGLGTDYKLKYYPKSKSFIERLVTDYEDDMKTSALKQETGEYYPLVRQWQRIKNYGGTQARMPYEFIIQ